MTESKKIAVLALYYGVSEAYLRALKARYAGQEQQTHQERMEEIERRRDTVLAECNPNLPTYEAK